MCNKKHRRNNNTESNRLISLFLCQRLFHKRGLLVIKFKESNDRPVLSLLVLLKSFRCSPYQVPMEMFLIGFLQSNTTVKRGRINVKHINVPSKQCTIEMRKLLARIGQGSKKLRVKKQRVKELQAKSTS